MAANRSKVVYIIHVYVMVTQSHCMFFTNLLLYWLFQIDMFYCVKANSSKGTLHHSNTMLVLRATASI